MLKLISASEVVTRVHCKKVAPVVVDDTKIDYKYNPFLGNSIESVKKVCNQVSSMAATTELVADIKRLHFTGVKCRARAIRLFAKIVNGPILQMLGTIVKTAVRIIKRTVRAVRTVRSVLRPVISGSSRHGRSSPVGRLFGRCVCGDYFKVMYSDRFNKIAVCGCGLMK